MSKKKKKDNPRRIKEDQVKGAVKAKYQRMTEELQKNPTNTVTSQRLADFKRIHSSKLIGV